MVKQESNATDSTSLRLGSSLDVAFGDGGASKLDLFLDDLSDVFSEHDDNERQPQQSHQSHIYSISNLNRNENKRHKNGAAAATTAPANPSSPRSLLHPQPSVLRSSAGDLRKSLSHAMLHNIDQAAFADRESQAVSYLRLVVLAVLVTTAACTAIAVFFYTRNSELRAFRASFKNDSQHVVEAVASSLYLWLGAMDAYVVSAVSIARATNQTWPFVTIPDAAVRLAKLRSLTKAESVHQAHYIQGVSEREQWENYTAVNDGWVSDALQVQREDKNHKGDTVDTVPTNGSIVNYFGPVTGEGPNPNWLPSWQAYPMKSGKATVLLRASH
jgi:hypothetical protein